MDLDTLIAGWTLLVAKTGAVGAAMVLTYVCLLLLLAWDIGRGLRQMVTQARATRALGRTHDRAYGEHRRGVGLQTPDGRHLGRLVGRATRRRAEGGGHRAD